MPEPPPVTTARFPLMSKRSSAVMAALGYYFFW